MNDGIWLLIGIIVGVIIENIVLYIKNKSQKKKNIKSLQFEINLNLKKIDKWLEYVDKYRKEVSTNTINNFYEYFDLSKAVFIIVNTLSINGELYSIINEDNVEKLQQNISFLSLGTENFINTQIRNKKNDVSTLNAAIKSNTPYIKTAEELNKEIVLDINWYEAKLKECKLNFKEIYESI